MSYSLHIASDVAQEKVNLEVPFGHQPGIDELRQVCESLLTQELVAREGSNAGKFGVGRMQIYDDDATQWVDLVSTAQIHPFDQLYVFPLDLENICQQRRELPPPRQVQLPRVGRSGSAYAIPEPPHRSASATHQPALRSTSQFSSSGVDAQFASQPRDTVTPTITSASVYPSNNGQTISSQSQHQQQSRGPNANGGSVNTSVVPPPSAQMNREDKIRFVFDRVDSSRRGFVTSRDFGDTLSHFGILFSATVINEMFGSVLDSVDGASQFQRSSNGGAPHWNLVDFTQWTRLFPVTFSVLYQRLFSRERKVELSATKATREDALAALRQRRDAIARQLQEVEQEIDGELRAVQQIDAEMVEVQSRRSQDDEEEQVIMDKEISIQHQRALLRREERDYEQLAERRGLIPDRRGEGNAADSGSSYSSIPHSGAYGGAVSSTARSLYSTPRGVGGLNSSRY